MNRSEITGRTLCNLEIIIARRQGLDFEIEKLIIASIPYLQERTEDEIAHAVYATAYAINLLLVQRGEPQLRPGDHITNIDTLASVISEIVDECASVVGEQFFEWQYSGEPFATAS